MPVAASPSLPVYKGRYCPHACFDREQADEVLPWLRRNDMGNWSRDHLEAILLDAQQLFEEDSVEYDYSVGVESLEAYLDGHGHGVEIV